MIRRFHFIVVQSTSKKCTKKFDARAAIVVFMLRWLDTVFQGQYLSSLSINYVAKKKVLEILPPQLY